MNKTKWRVFISGDQAVALGIKVRQGEAGLYIPEIVALSNAHDYRRLDRVTFPQQRHMEIEGARAALTVKYVRCVVPLTWEDRTVNVAGAGLAEDRELRAVPNYGKRGTWYKVTPR